MKTKLIAAIITLTIYATTAHADPDVAKCASISYQHSSVAKIQQAIAKRAEVINAHNNLIEAVNFMLRETTPAGEEAFAYGLRRNEPGLFYVPGTGLTPNLSGPINFQTSSEQECVDELDKQLTLLGVARSHTLHGSISLFQLALKNAGLTVKSWVIE